MTLVEPQTQPVDAVRLRRTTPPYHTVPAGFRRIRVVCEWCSAESGPIPIDPPGLRPSIKAAHGGVLNPTEPAECPKALPPAVAEVRL